LSLLVNFGPIQTYALLQTLCEMSQVTGVNVKQQLHQLYKTDFYLI